jgi:ABC-type transport system substrate-binding protein
VLSFDNPAAAAEAKGRAADLQQALQQAGINVSQNGLSFTSGGGQGHSAWQSPTPASYAQRGLSGPLAADETPASTLQRAAAKAGGLDITI